MTRPACGSLPFLPVVLGACDDSITYYLATGCVGAVLLTSVVDEQHGNCFSSLTADAVWTSDPLAYIPSNCCSGPICGGGQLPTVAVGDIVSRGVPDFLQVDIVSQVLENCLAIGITDFVVPIGSCTGQCDQTTSVLGFTAVRVFAAPPGGVDLYPLCAVAGGGTSACGPTTTSTTTTSTTTTTLCTAVCGNRVCEIGEGFDCEDCALIGVQLPLLPIAIGSCYLDAFAASGQCADLPTRIDVPNTTDDACFSTRAENGGPAARLLETIPPTCCSGTTCGGGSLAYPPLGEEIVGVGGNLDTVLAVLADCAADYTINFRVPIIPCGQCAQKNPVLGFTDVTLTSVVSTGGTKHVELTIPCPRCGDGACTGPDETCQTCRVDCGNCPPMCQQ